MKLLKYIFLLFIALPAHAQVQHIDKIQLSDKLGGIAHITQMGQLKVVELHRLAGGVFNDAILDSNFYSNAVSANGTATVSNGLLTLSTTTDSGSSVAVSTVGLARYIGANSNYLRAVARFGDTGKANNVRRICAIDTLASPQNGYCYQISGTTFSVVSYFDGTPTTVNSGSFNGNGSETGVRWPIDTSFHTFEIYFTARKILFAIDDEPIHTITATTAQISGTRHLRPALYNVNTGIGSVVNLYCEVMTINRLGQAYTQPKYWHVSGANTGTLLKTGPGTLRKVNVGAFASGTAVFLYNALNATDASKLIAKLDGGTLVGPITSFYDIEFDVGLYAVTTGSSTDATIIYE